jgi:3-hydroxyacyl-CoA dehydrogenase
LFVFKAAVVGAGTMGGEIAQAIANADIPVVLKDIDQKFVDAGLEKAREVTQRQLGGLVKKEKLTQEQADARLDEVMGLITGTTSYDEFGDVDFVVEAAPEKMEIKQAVFAEIDEKTPGHAVLASNTSSLSITRIAKSTGRRDRVIGIHFFNPVAAMPLVEIVAGRETSAQTQTRALELVESLGKQAVRVSDTPGFATSRLGVALGLEAMRMLEEGVADAADIDRAMELGYGHRMGPLKTSDLVGLDVRLSIAETLASGLDADRFRTPRILTTLVAEWHTGRKSGEGFYRWDGDRAAGPGERAAALARKR